MKEAPGSSETSVLTRATRRNNPEDTILQKTACLRSMLRLLVTANVVPSSPILFTLMMETTSFSETSVLIRATRCKIPEGGILDSLMFRGRWILLNFDIYIRNNFLKIISSIYTLYCTAAA
jgi:hypothetical protein